MKVIAFAALVLALAGCSSDDPDEAAAPQPVTVTETETVTETTTVSKPEARCSSATVHATVSDQELPQAVAEVRRRIFEAAVACDYDALEQIAEEQGEGFTFSYGADTDASEYWRRAEESTEEPRPLRALVTILTMPYTRNESGSYAWPTAYDESPTEEAWRLLAVSGLYTREQIDSMRAAGSFLGYRTAITPDGDWQFFVAGD